MLRALFFDADNDGDPDLYVGSGGNEFSIGSPWLRDRLYVNRGDGTFDEAANVLPDLSISTGCVKSADYDGDGDQDLFIGGRVLPGAYPVPASSYLLENQLKQTGEIKFIDVTEDIIPWLSNIGLVTDALWTDYDGDGRVDLIISGEWMPVKAFRNVGNGFVDHTELLGLNKHKGWWYSLASGDFDEDGDLDFIAGNLGDNYKYQASAEEPFEIFSGDYDGNKRRDIVLSYHQAGNLFPLRGRECSSEQIPAIKLKFKDYESFANATVFDVYGRTNLERGLHYQATTFSTSYIENTGDRTWAVKPLPMEVQLSAVNGILVDDLDNDGHLDLLISGNLFAAEVETTRNDASVGLYLRGDGTGKFDPMPPAESGLYLNGDVKDMSWIQLGNSQAVLIGENNNNIRLIEYSGGQDQDNLDDE